MKKVAIVGAGISGLRAGLEIAGSNKFKIQIFEKSSSVGGRVATRRYNEGSLNHGASSFDDSSRVLKVDSYSKEFSQYFNFDKGATLLPKAMRDHLLLNPLVELKVNQKVASISHDGHLKLDNGETRNFDHVLITAPMNQGCELLNIPTYPDIKYSKKILFIGFSAGKFQKIELPIEFSDQIFDLSDEGIRTKATQLLNKELDHLDLKRWKYSEVSSGILKSYMVFNNCITFAGDAFDPQKKFNLAAAWLSGLEAAQYIKKQLGDII